MQIILIVWVVAESKLGDQYLICGMDHRLLASFEQRS